MIKVTTRQVTLAVERNPLTELLSSLDEEATLKSSIATDLTILFVALIKKYDISTTATLIYEALQTAQEEAGNAKVDIRKCDN